MEKNKNKRNKKRKRETEREAIISSIFVVSAIEFMVSSWTKVGQRLDEADDDNAYNKRS